MKCLIESDRLIAYNSRQPTCLPVTRSSDSPAFCCYRVIEMGRHGASSFPFLFFISFGLLITTTPLASGSCYYPDGTLAGAEYQACSNYEGAIGPCCALNRTTEISNGTSQNWTRDTCLPNGLCKNVSFQEGKTIYAYWRDQCSSPDWPGDRCPRICLEGSVYIESLTIVE